MAPLAASSWPAVLTISSSRLCLAAEVFNVSLNVPALQMDEIVRVVRHLNAFDLQDIPPAVDCLASHAGKRVPLKKLLLWVEMAKQGLEPGAFIPLDQWSQVLRDLS
eukprot:gene14964-21021_t